jgi:hypothetical protein
MLPTRDAQDTDADGIGSLSAGAAADDELMLPVGTATGTAAVSCTGGTGPTNFFSTASSLCRTAFIEAQRLDISADNALSGLATSPTATGRLEATGPHLHVMSGSLCRLTVMKHGKTILFKVSRDNI